MLFSKLPWNFDMLFPKFPSNLYMRFSKCPFTFVHFISNLSFRLNICFSNVLLMHVYIVFPNFPVSCTLYTVHWTFVSPNFPLPFFTVFPNSFWNLYDIVFAQISSNLYILCPKFPWNCCIIFPRFSLNLLIMFPNFLWFVHYVSAFPSTFSTCCFQTCTFVSQIFV